MVRLRLLISIGSAVLACALAAGSANAAAGPALSVDASAGRHAIDPAIYGMNFADETLAEQIDLPVDRWGGNAVERYNYLEGIGNRGADWYFENIPDCFGVNPCNSSADRGYRAYQDFIEQDRRTGADSLITLPLIGYASNNPTYGHPFHCGFPSSAYPSQQSFDPWDSNCGNGKSGGGANLAPPDPLTTTSRSWGAAENAGWVDDLKSRYGGVRHYELGNEPNLWDSTHRDVHPAPTTYDELWQKTRDSAAAVKAHDPAGNVLMFSEWGWPHYLCSAKDTEALGYCSASAPDRAAHGGTPLVEWLLQQAAAYQASHGGQRIVDYLDLHYYRQGGNTTDVTRSLWDPTYTDPSWINEKIELIPRMKRWVADNYPGTKLSLSEYDLGGTGNATTDFLIQAEVLGIFAREGLDMATRWGPPAAGDELADAWRLYRNYDGQGSKFGGTWVRSSSADQSKLAVYGAQRSADGAVTAMVVNKSASDLSSSLDLAGFEPLPSAHAFRWSGSGIDRLADLRVSGGSVAASFPARSVTLIVVGNVAGGSDNSGRVKILSARLDHKAVRRASACRRGVQLKVRLSGAARITALLQRIRGKKAKTVVRATPKKSGASYKLRIKPCVKRRPLAPRRYALRVMLTQGFDSKLLHLRVRR